MLDAKLEYELVLRDLEKQKQNEKDPQKIELLEKSIKKIQKYLNPTPKEINDEEKTELQNKREKEITSIKSFFRSKMFRGYEFSCFTIFNINRKKLETITLDFIKNTNFQLSKSFKNANITQLKQKREQDGTTIFVKPINKNYVFISKNDVLMKAITLIHELAHARVNDIRKESIRSKYFNEVYPKFLELVFSDYLIENGLEKHGHNVKVKLLKEIKKHIWKIKEYEEDGQIFFALYNYNAIKDNILALELYIKYKKNPEEISKKLENFICYLGKKDETDLLKILDLDNSIFTDLNISNNFKNILETERKEIKQK